MYKKGGNCKNHDRYEPEDMKALPFDACRKACKYARLFVHREHNPKCVCFKKAEKDGGCETSNNRHMNIYKNLS